MGTGREPETQAAEYMARALALAERGFGLAPPNPVVGALLVKDGRVVGEGWHEGPGSPHAEMAAISAAGGDARGATLYTTLEPCAHHGRTPPCAPAIVDAGVTEVIVAALDPNPVVDGRGIRSLRDSSLRVTEGLLQEPAERMNAGFAKHVRTGLPYVTLKLAASLDGKTAARDGSSRWITGEDARHDAHRLRARSGAIVVGAGTVVADDPSLSVRLDGFRGRQPLRVVVDGRGRIPRSVAIFDRSAPTLVATTASAPAEVRREWEDAGAEVVVMENGRERMVPLRKLVELLGKRDVQDVLIEGGPTIAWAVVEGRLVDRMVLYFAPKLIGGERAPGILDGAGIPDISEAISLTVTDVTWMGDDLKVVADVHGDR
jgi:diaminohydroxyphosphoribosylaminopyrimidine deaminase/5-amino-6-(5-phosphoribosylamino)uracil reductase